ncbi:alpha/beta hydrolase [Alisedimentitalea sp. MJ-SS2]|uniref:alpha/beta hydrolase n=1 Tax=Aliisedimentitalea sp. MJ-SS2 TaxID=3049795 RepID=UPI0029140813|nr:alpha/beta hydrolase [Alisedimentitalea sp. MJ-SS2]MDU8927505.1 alpha/beta hydrolase [Alisedimentitalea sp. MJ-SS2]
METAPFFAAIADGPEDGAAWWLTAEDGVQIRVGLWNRDATKGTVLLFPGRTEYVEKYGRTAHALAARGFATLSIDWRGQGIADRLVEDPATGHVHWFSDYQKDVKAVLDAARDLELPEPFYLLAHSMGGCIGLRALNEGLPVRAAAFSAPMWGISLAPATRPAAWAIAWGGKLMGLGHAYAPGTGAQNYVVTAPFEDNMLTTDPEMWEYMKRQVETHPELLLGGPSLRWLHEALSECRELDRMASPPHPTITFLGTNERIVDATRIHSRMTRWPNGQLEMIDPGEHEVLMDTQATQDRIFDTMVAFFDNPPAEHAPANQAKVRASS